MRVKRLQESPTKIIAPMNARLKSTNVPFPAPSSRRQNHRSEILVNEDESENKIWKHKLSFCSVGSQASGTSQICRFQAQRSVASEVTTAIAIANMRPMTIRRSSMPALHVMRKRVKRRSMTTNNAMVMQTIFTTRTPWPRVGGSI